MGKDAKIIIKVKKIKGTSFVGLRDYANKEGEISNQTLLVGISFANLLQNDYQKLVAFNVADLVTDTLPLAVLNEAKNELLESLEKRLSTPDIRAELLANNDATIKRSVAQTEAYTHICNGLKLKDGFVYLYGLMMRKTVLQAIQYKTVNSSLKTIAKNVIKKAADLRERKYKNFKIEESKVIIDGVTL